MCTKVHMYKVHTYIYFLMHDVVLVDRLLLNSCYSRLLVFLNLKIGDKINENMHTEFWKN